MRRISILGSTGSIGCSTLDVISQQPDAFEMVALTAQNNAAKLIEQAKKFQPKAVVIGDEAHYETVKDALAATDIDVSAGAQALCDAAARPADLVMAAIVGVAGLNPTMAAIKTGASIAFASKECLVCAGDLMMDACKQSGSTLLPVDSEHNAIFQVFDFDQPDKIAKLTLTASGGPFRNHTAAQLASVTPEQAVAHPNWDMGAKISVDSATMMNKALEMIEAYHLFPVEADQIDAIIHPQSIIHSLVHYRDGSVLAQLGMPDMRIPIAHTLGWPKRLAVNTPTLSLSEIGTLEFAEPDVTRFPALRLVRDVMAGEQSLSIAFNAANEVAVAAFLAKRLPFIGITELVEKILDKTSNNLVPSIEDALYLDEEIREKTKELLSS
jgi:1-deoxy-D-xylulose-5-phosphate reductoisomerase